MTYFPIYHRFLSFPQGRKTRWSIPGARTTDNERSKWESFWWCWILLLDALNAVPGYCSWRVSNGQSTVGGLWICNLSFHLCTFVPLCWIHCLTVFLFHCSVCNNVTLFTFTWFTVKESMSPWWTNSKITRRKPPCTTYTTLSNGIW